MKPVRVCILGFGGIARSHFKAYQRLKREHAPVELVALCDIDPSQFTKESETNLGSSKALSLEGLNLYTDYQTMLAAEKPDMVDICLPSYLHCEYAVKVLKAGCHVLCEKPMGLNQAQCDEMIVAAEESGKHLMIGQCLRFDPAYQYLKARVDDGSFGALHYAHFDRLSALPLWGFDHWFQDDKRSGGCAMDMHIHDVDMVRYLFGEPRSVSAISTGHRCKWRVIHSRFDYGNGTLVVAEGSWDESPTRPFRMSFRVRFEKAEVILDSSGLKVYPEEGEPYAPELSSEHRMAEEIRCMAEHILGTSTDSRISAREAAKTVALVEKLQESSDQGGTAILL